MYRVNVVLYSRTDTGWKFHPVRKTRQGKFIWDNQDGGVYYLEWYEDGRRRRQTAGTGPAEVHDARRRKVLELKGSALEHGRKVVPGASSADERPLPLAATIDVYLNHTKLNQKLNTYRRYRSVLYSFRDYLATKRYLNELSRGDILDYRDFRAGIVSSPVTLNSEITMIRAMLYWCVKFKGLRENPAANIKPRSVVQKPPEVFNDKEIHQMLHAANPEEQAILITLLYTDFVSRSHATWPGTMWILGRDFSASRQNRKFTLHPRLGRREKSK